MGLNLLRKAVETSNSRVDSITYSTQVKSEEHVEIVDEVENALIDIFDKARIKDDEYAMSWSMNGGIHFLVVKESRAGEVVALLSNKKISINNTEYRVYLQDSLTTRADGYKNFEIELFKK